MRQMPGVIEDYIAAYNRNDADGMLECLSDDVWFRNVSGGDVTAEATGKDSFGEMAAFGASAFESRHQEVTDTITVLDTTLIKIAYTAVLAKDLPNGLKAGQELSFAGSSLFKVEDDMITVLVDES